MTTRRNIRSLTPQERGHLIDAILELKKDGTYDRFVDMHVNAMGHGTPPVGPGVVARNGAHRGPSFLPWHRYFLGLFEKALQAKNSTVTLPYWDWTADAQTPDASPVWEIVGGNGDSADGWKVKGKPFGEGHWELKVDVANGGKTLRRRFGELESRAPNGTVTRVSVTLPTEADVRMAMAERHYDAVPYSDSPYCTGFRNRLEGWIVKRADPAVPTQGTQLHNRVHVFVGGSWIDTGPAGAPINVGGTMLIASSPNDPVFFLHHCFVDKLWADWQGKRKAEDPNGQPHYAPLADGPAGHNLLDGLYPWGDAATPLSVLDPRALGYDYDTDSQPLDQRFLIAAKPTQEEAWDELIDTHFTTSSWLAASKIEDGHHHGHGDHR
ncbi:MAG: tyrosinase family protein [Hyphomonadaceae bacterium]|jgi:tyrosinase|nr:tyrosinase family protein [Hyphomonadaceae bacterium]